MQNHMDTATLSAVVPLLCPTVLEGLFIAVPHRLPTCSCHPLAGLSPTHVQCAKLTQLTPAQPQHAGL